MAEAQGPGEQPVLELLDHTLSGRLGDHRRDVVDRGRGGQLAPGVTPNMRTPRLPAVDTRMTGRNAVVNARSGTAVASKVAGGMGEGQALGDHLGEGGVDERDEDERHHHRRRRDHSVGEPPIASNSRSNRTSTVGSATKPRSRDTTVMPSWVAASISDRWSRQASPAWRPTPAVPVTRPTAPRARCGGWR